jgi:hypothetical protein
MFKGVVRETRSEAGSRRAIWAMLLLMMVPASLCGQQSSEGHIGLPIDWSHRHVIFTNGASPSVAAATARDPRSWINWAQRSSVLFQRPVGVAPLPRASTRRTHIDWAISLGPNGGVPIAEAPAKFSFSASGNLTFPASCNNDFVVFPIAATPKAGGQANIVALRNLYTGTTSSSCPNGPQTPPTTNLTAPTFMWSYAVGTGPLELSPALSLNGTQVAFVEASSRPMFDVLTWSAGQGIDATHAVAPGGASTVTRLDYTNITTSSCPRNATRNNSNSSPYIDYASNSAFVGADNGVLYHIKNVFGSTAPSLDFCITVKAGAVLTSPVFDPVTQRVFISDGFVLYSYFVSASSFTSERSITVAGTGASDPIVLSPILDSTNGLVYLFSGTDLTNTNSIVAQVNRDQTTLITAPIGPAFTGQFILDGDFDNAYFANGPTSGAGTLYACGTQAGNPNKPSLYAMSFQATSGQMNSTPVVSDNRNINGASNPNGVCSPLLEFFDGTTDRLFVGTGQFNNTGGANLVTEWDITNRIATSTTAPNHTAINEWGGTSAFTPDNVSTAPQAASIYFGTLAAAPGATPCGNGNFCAVKLTQSGLQ